MNRRSYCEVYFLPAVWTMNGQGCSQARKVRAVSPPRLRGTSMDHVLGTLKGGRIILDEQPDWPKGQRVWVMPGLDDEPPGTVLPRVRLADGKRVPINGSPEHNRLLAEQIGEGEPVEMTPEEEARWHADLKWIGDYTLEAVRNDMGL